MLRFTLTLAMIATAAFSQEWKHFTAANSGLPSDLVYALKIAPDGTVWAGTGNGLAALKGNTWTVYDTSNSPLPDPYITALAVDSANSVWIGTGFAGAARLSNGAWSLFDSANSGLPGNTVFDITVGPDQTPWFASDDGVVNLKENVWSNLKQKMIEPRSRSVAFDRSGTLWMGTYDPVDFRGYIEYKKGDSFSHTILSKLDIFSTYAHTMLAADDSTIYVGTGNGLARVVNGVWTIYHKQDSPLPANGIGALAVFGDTVLVGTASGIVEIANGSWNVILPSSEGLPGDAVTDIAVDEFGNRWIATMSSGIVLYKKGGIVTHLPKEKSAPSEFSLQQNFPNPFNPTTVIRYQLPAGSYTTLIVYDALGREAATLVNEVKEAGYYTVPFNASHLASGVYFARLTGGAHSQVIKMMVMK